MKLVKTFTVTCGEQASEFMLGRVSGMLSTINVNKYEFSDSTYNKYIYLLNSYNSFMTGIE